MSSPADAAAVTIRWADAQDEARLLEIDHETWSPLVTPAPASAASTFFRPHVEPSDTLVAVIGDSVAGYALIGAPTPHPASARVQMIRGLAVAPGYQGRGIGRALVDAAIEKATARSAVKLSLRVLATNEVARRLYTAAGFETEGVLVDEFLLEGRGIAVAGEGLRALLLEGLLPGTEQGLSDVQGAGRLRHGVAFLRDQFDCLDLELVRVTASLSRHDGPPGCSLHRYLGVHHSWGGSRAIDAPPYFGSFSMARLVLLGESWYW